MADRARIDDSGVADRLARVDTLLERIERTPGRTAESAIEAIQALAELYGEALARVLDQADQHLTERFLGDDLLGHLLVLHELHPETVEHRVARAVHRLKPAAGEYGCDIEFHGVEGNTALVELTPRNCGGSQASVAAAVREAVLAAAPELSEVRQRPAASQRAAFVPLDSLTHRPLATQQPT